MNVGEVDVGREGQGWSRHWSAPRGSQVGSGGADLAHAPDVGYPHRHRVGAAAPSSLSGICAQSRILGSLRRVERGARKWAGGGAGRRGGARSSGGGKGNGGDYGVGESNIIHIKEFF